MDVASLLLMFLGNNAGAVASMVEMEGALDGVGKSAEGSSQKMGLLSAVGPILAVAAAAIVVVGAVSLKMAADYETSTTRLVTSAGEQVRNLDLVRTGMLKMAGEVGISAEDLSKAMYVVESAGYHGAEGLTVLRAAAEGAKTENADLGVVANAVTSVLRDYHLPASQAAQVTTELVAAVSQGKTTFEALTGSLHSVLPIASAANISLADITGALASMTVHGISADEATQNMAHTIQHLQTVTAPQAKELAALGISARQLSDDLGKKGLTGTLQEVSDSITAHMGADQHVVLDLRDALAKLPPEVRKLGAEAAAGTISMGDYQKAAKGLSVEAAGQAQGFATLLKATHGVGQDQKSGADIMQSYAAALKAATGDSTTLNVALMLTGENSKYTNDAVKAVGASTTEAGNHVAGWGEIQSTFNNRLDRFKDGAGAAAIALGTQLLPAASKLMGQVADATPVILSLATGLGTVLGGAATVAGAALGVIAPLLGVLLSHADLLLPVLAGVVASWVAWNVALGITKGIEIVQALIAMVTWFLELTAGENLATVATVLFDVAMDSNPIGVVALAIGILIGLLVLLVTHWSQVTGALGRFWGMLRSVSDAAMSFIDHNRVLAVVILLLTGPLGVVIGLLVVVISHWDAITGAAGRALGAVHDFFLGHNAGADAAAAKAKAVADQLAAIKDKEIVVKLKSEGAPPEKIAGAEKKAQEDTQTAALSSQVAHHAAMQKDTEGWVQKTAHAIGGFWSGVGSITRTGVTDVGKAFSGLGSAAHSAVAAVGSGFSTLGSVAHAGVADAGKAFSGLGTAVHSAVSGVGSGMSAVGSAVSGGLNRVVHVAEAAWSQFSSRPVYWIVRLLLLVPGLLFQIVVAAVRWAEGVVKAGIDAGTKFLAAAEDWLSKAPGRFEDWLGRVLSRLGDWASQTAQWAVTTGTTFLANAEAWLSQAPGRFWNWLMQTLTRFGQWEVATAQWAVSTGQKFLSNMASWLSQLPGQIGSALGGALSAVVSWGTDLVSRGLTAAKNFIDSIRSAIEAIDWGAIGSAIVHGIASGITGAVGSLAGAAASAANQALQAAKDAIGAKSPSERAAKEVGEPIPEGAALGIRRKAGVMADALTGLLKLGGSGGAPGTGITLAPTATLAFAAQGAGGATNAGKSTGDVNVYVTHPAPQPYQVARELAWVLKTAR